jgi:hypothetical protein
MNGLEIDLIIWDELDHFSESEFPAGVTEKVSPAFLCSLDKFRKKLGFPVTPSPLEAGWFRTDGSTTSRHFIGKDGELRKADAGDMFTDCDIFYAMVIAVQCGFTGIGLYVDTTLGGKKRYMLHLDKRPGELVIWVRESGIYTTIHPRPNADVFDLLK